MMKRTFLLALSLLCSIFAHPLLAAELLAGKHYTVIEPPIASAAPAGKIEVIEFFSYGCPHCKDFSPLINQWAAKLPKDVSFRRVPVSFGRPAWEKLASIYYSLETTGNLAKLDEAVFKAIHDEHVNFSSNESITTWAASKGGDAKKIGEALDSFSMKSQIRRGDQEAQAAKIGGVPALVVGGRYYINNAEAKGYDELLRLTDDMIAQVRKNGGK